MEEMKTGVNATMSYLTGLSRLFIEDAVEEYSEYQGAKEVDEKTLQTAAENLAEMLFNDDDFMNEIADKAYDVLNSTMDDIQ